ncbi:MAG TPA: hypothetical protein VKG38_06800 [Solirubrobacteraceae bacterium]|nr:hypothetical protein [Solirubrobacteraceae bacterium]
MGLGFSANVRCATGKPSGLHFGDGPTAIVFALAVLLLVSYLALARPDIQKPLEASHTQARSTPVLPDLLHPREPEVELD